MENKVVIRSLNLHYGDFQALTDVGMVIPERRITFNHAFRNTMNPFITSSSNLLAELFSGSLILEIIFSYPGIGRLMYEAVLQKDINLVMTNIMFISFLILVGMLLSDVALALVDPRVRYSAA